MIQNFYRVSGTYSGSLHPNLVTFELLKKIYIQQFMVLKIWQSLTQRIVGTIRAINF